MRGSPATRRNMAGSNIAESLSLLNRESLQVIERRKEVEQKLLEVEALRFLTEENYKRSVIRMKTTLEVTNFAIDSLWDAAEYLERKKDGRDDVGALAEALTEIRKALKLVGPTCVRDSKHTASRGSRKDEPWSEGWEKEADVVRPNT
jgi:hypothetical protein